MITIRFACGHQVASAGTEPPRCSECGETRIAHVDAPAPVFRGAVSGPCAVPSQVRPFVGPLKES